MSASPGARAHHFPAPAGVGLRSWSAGPAPLLGAIAREVHLSWRFISNDVWATLVPGTCFVLAAAQHQHLSMAETAGACALGAGYFWLFIYRFTLGDQLVGVAEDRIVKPFRPLVAGQSSRRGAQRRLVAVNIAFPIYALLLGVLPFALAWQLLCLLNNRWHRSWLTKNLLPGLGVITQLGAAWQIAAPLTPTVWRWILTLAGAVLLMIGIQDLRDVAGDRAQGRRTMPIVFGDRAVRVYFYEIGRAHV